MATEVTTLDGSSDAALAAGPRSGRARSRWATAGWYLVLTLLSVIVLFPVYMLLLRAISDPLAYVAEGQPLHPVAVEWDAFTNAFTEASLGRSMALSFVVTLVIVVAQLLTSVLAAYAFAFLEFPFKGPIFVFYIATMLVPGEVTVVFNQRTADSLGWINSYQGLIVPSLASTFGVFLVRQVFLQLPHELREAASLDGVGHLRFLWEVAAPLSRPTLGALGLFTFLGTWNAYLWPSQVIRGDRAHETIQIGLDRLKSNDISRLNLVTGGLVVAALPIFILLVVFQRQLVRGLTAGAVKG